MAVRCQILIIAHNHRQEDVVVQHKQSAVPACGKFANHDTNTIAGTALLRPWVAAPLGSNYVEFGVE